MATYMVGYQLNKSGQDYKSLYEALQGFGTYWHHMTSTWIVVSNLSAKEVRDKLTQHLDENDHLLVATLTGEAAWYGINERGSKWLKDHL